MSEWVVNLRWLSKGDNDVDDNKYNNEKYNK